MLITPVPDCQFLTYNKGKLLAGVMLFGHSFNNEIYVYDVFGKKVVGKRLKAIDPNYYPYTYLPLFEGYSYEKGEVFFRYATTSGFITRPPNPELQYASIGLCYHNEYALMTRYLETNNLLQVVRRFAGLKEIANNQLIVVSGRGVKIFDFETENVLKFPVVSPDETTASITDGEQVFTIDLY